MSDMRRMMMMFTKPVDSGGSTIPVPTISPSAGAILPTQTISISVSGIAISAEYSTDNVNWSTYTTPFTLSGNTTVYARALDGDGNYSDVVSNSYIVLPYDARVEYLQGVGTTTWIDTGFIPKQDDIRVVADVEIITVASNNIFYGMYASSTPKLNQNWTTSGTVIYFRCNSYDNSFSTTKARHVFENGTSIKIDEVVKATPTFTKTFANNTAHVVLFGNPNAAVPSSISSTSPFKGKIYEFSIYYGNNLKLHLVPVRKDDVGYMYDTVSNTLLGNNGSGTFLYGNDITT